MNDSGFAAPRRSPRTSPRIPDHKIARYPAAAAPPAPHTSAELTRLLAMLHQTGAVDIAIGHGRAATAVAAAHALREAWTAADGTVLAAVHWPADAASWLRPARRLTAGPPDAWVVADGVAGCAQLVARLAEQANWCPARTFGFAALAGPDLVALTAPTCLSGLTGATATGGTWHITDGGVVAVDGPDRRVSIPRRPST